MHARAEGREEGGDGRERGVGACMHARACVHPRARARVLTDARGVAGGPPARAELEHASSICSFILRASVAIHRIDTVVLPLFPAWCWKRYGNV